ncbi:MAG: VWA domain-containing protein [Rhodospirillaceae bacterium]|jgi:nitric oxide reductase NorD protein|nr:VWA domain-containing protein [Rhodospirillaceae bacterium]MBT5243424.1 VWA domain-containing protein [Rhodospirillaceae bacterium]MBT5563429.1 VWA domain-containing protein [Rhodospirillaceae bacterium]MBT6241104.1 VWA domain-containing protein [Rhodospirillaceae bacterium]MBT7137619.1 VWA domain-containing protein [Rhodospirillaceae bacterium]
MRISEDALAEYRDQLSCSFSELDDVFAACMENACVKLSDRGVKDYLSGGSLIGGIGRGVEPVLVYLEEMPEVAAKLGEGVLSLVSETVWTISRTPNGQAIPPFLNTIAEAARRLGSLEHLCRYIDIILDMMDRSTGSIHGHHDTIPSPALPTLLNQIPYLLGQLSLIGLNNWIDYGVRAYANHPERQQDYFSLQSADSRAILQRERHGTLFTDHERNLDLYMKALWDEKTYFIPYSTGFDELRKPRPYFDELGIRVPDVYDAINDVNGIDRYRALLAHIAAHHRWSEAIFADNFSPFQRYAVEVLEDCRVEALAMQEFPGLRHLFKALHPRPIEGDCDPDRESCIRHRMAMLSYATLDPDHGYDNEDICDFVQRFHEMLKTGEGSTQETSMLAVKFVARTRLQSDQSADMYFTDTDVDYRDDNRHMWKFFELGDEEEMFDEHDNDPTEEAEEEQGLPPRHYPEWDYATKTYRPDWVSLYESLHPAGDSNVIDGLLEKHASLAKRLKQMLDLLKPQQYVRVRYQEEGSELDLDVAIRSLIDFKSGATPDPRINMSHRHDGRDIAVMLLLDLSESVAQVPEGCSQSILELAQEAVALLGWAIENLGDSFAIAGFSSNTRHQVRYQHIKGFSESWNNDVKGRLAAMEAGYSTRMGAALRHGAHYLGTRQADKKLLLVLTDGEPSDIDVDDDRQLIEDAHKAVQELDQQGIYTYCINLDPQADSYVQDVFGQRYTVIDRVERLPEKLPQLFMSLTK